jgi:hypothetical protein
MIPFRTFSLTAAVILTGIAATGCSTTGYPIGGERMASNTDRHMAQANRGPGASAIMPGPAGSARREGMNAQMQTMRELHDKMLAAKTPEERRALMAEQMTALQNGMHMMGGMGPGPMMDRPGDMDARQDMLEQRMQMMQSMMQMMMDRESVPMTK